MAVYFEIEIFQNESVTALVIEVSNYLHDIDVLDIESIQIEIFPIYAVIITFKHTD